MINLTLDKSLDIDSKPKSEKEAWSVHLKNKWWRLNNLYFIKDKNGKKVRFRPNAIQIQFLKDCHGRDIILKARQLGMTTLIQIWFLDECLFNPNTNAGVIAHTRDDAIAFFKDKIKFAYDNLAPYLKDKFKAKNDTANELRFEHGSVIRVGTSLRSGTNQLLHISEYGKLCARYPDKAEEVRTGAFPTVPKDGWIIIESTAEGRIGDFYDKCQEARRMQAGSEALGQMDFAFHFFPWWQDETYSLDEAPRLGVDMARYFDELQKIDLVLSDGQKAFYVSKVKETGDHVKREYPSTPDEAFQANIEGAYFTRALNYVRAKGQICRVPIEHGIPIHTAWDLGRDTTAIWFFQKVGFDYRMVNYYEHEGEGMEYYLHALKQMKDGDYPYIYGTMYLPHDGTRRSLTSNKSPADLLYDAGYQVALVSRTPSKDASIEQARRVITQCYFDIDRCDEGLSRLEAYRKERDERLDTWKPNPLHDKASHGSDAFMTFSDGFFDEQEYQDDTPQESSYGRNSTTGY